MPDNRRILYWDACAFLSYINEIPERIPVLQALLADSASENAAVRIYTSALSRVETSFASTEQQNKALSSEVEGRIAGLWNDPGAVVLVEFHDLIGQGASQLMRDGIPRGWSLKPLDALHLATARWLHSVGVEISEFQTYDRQLLRYSVAIGIPIAAPSRSQPQLL